MLNAFRHQRRNHPTVVLISAMLLWCSTPFGINEGITRYTVYVFLYDRGAQRLSASTKESPLHSRNSALNHTQCSTPFGINEGITDEARRWYGSEFSCSTPFGINEGITLHSRSSCVNHIQCSTPFGINEGITGTRPRQAILPQAVLNAFRHQRRNHSPIVHSITRESLCSTPFGINEGITLEGMVQPIVSDRAQRLSASTKESP